MATVEGFAPSLTVQLTIAPPSGTFAGNTALAMLCLTNSSISHAVFGDVLRALATFRGESAIA